MPTRHQVCAWVAGCGLLVPSPALAQTAPSVRSLNVVVIPILYERFGRSLASDVLEQESV